MTDPREEIFAELIVKTKEGDLGIIEECGEIETKIYHCDDVLKEEQENVFRDSAFIVGHETMLKQSGDHMAFDHLGQPIILTRAKDGKIRAFLNACRHRGVRLVDGQEVKRRPSMVCPYHNWAYGMDGKLIAVPLEESFPNLDKSCRSLKSLPCEVRHGFIWVNPNPEGELDLDSHLGDINQDLEAFGIENEVFFKQSLKRKKTNWKLIIDAFLDGYHVKRLHKNTVGPFFIDCAAVTKGCGVHIRSVVGRNELAEAFELEREKWDYRHHCTFAYLIFPNTILIFHPDYSSILSVYPVAPDETLVSHICLTPHEPKDEAELAHYERAFNIIENGVFEAEDFFVCEQAQKGMLTGANDTFLVGGHEAGLQVFHDILKQQLKAKQA